MVCVCAQTCVYKCVYPKAASFSFQIIRRDQEIDTGYLRKNLPVMQNYWVNEASLQSKKGMSFFKQPMSEIYTEKQGNKNIRIF